MPLTAEQIAKACGCRIERANKWHLPLNDAMAEYGITTPARQAAFLAQVAHESARLGVLEENLNYSAEGLVKVFPRHFPALKAAALYARRPEKIASKVYANRLGNGDEESGEGWLYRGRGLIQITGADNYRACGTALGLDLIASPEKLTIPRPAAFSAAWFWSSRNLNALADHGDFTAITKAINGGTNGLQDRLALFGTAKEALA